MEFHKIVAKLEMKKEEIGNTQNIQFSNSKTEKKVNEKKKKKDKKRQHTHIGHLKSNFPFKYQLINY